MNFVNESFLQHGKEKMEEIMEIYGQTESNSLLWRRDKANRRVTLRYQSLANTWLLFNILRLKIPDSTLPDRDSGKSYHKQLRQRHSAIKIQTLRHPWKANWVDREIQIKQPVAIFNTMTISRSTHWLSKSSSPPMLDYVSAISGPITSTFTQTFIWDLNPIHETVLSLKEDSPTYALRSCHEPSSSLALWPWSDLLNIPP